MDYGIFNVRTDVNASNCTRGCTDTVRESAQKVDSGEKKKKSLPHRVILPVTDAHVYSSFLLINFPDSGVLMLMLNVSKW